MQKQKKKTHTHTSMLEKLLEMLIWACVVLNRQCRYSNEKFKVYLQILKKKTN